MRKRPVFNVQAAFGRAKIFKHTEFLYYNRRFHILTITNLLLMCIDKIVARKGTYV